MNVLHLPIWYQVQAEIFWLPTEMSVKFPGFPDMLLCPFHHGAELLSIEKRTYLVQEIALMEDERGGRK